MSKRGNGEGSIYRRKSDGKWVGSVTLEDGKRKVFYGRTRKEVKDKLNQALHDQKKGTLITTPDQFLKDYLEHWLEEVKKPFIRTSTYVKYKKLLKYIIPKLGDIKLQKLTPQHVQALCTAKLKDGLQPKTVHSIRGLLHDALDNAVKWDLVTRNVCDRVSLPPIRKAKIQTLSLEQARKLFDHLHGNRLEMLITMALTTGLRRGELLALRWTDIVLELRTVQVQHTVDYIPKHGYVENDPKTEAGRRTVVLPMFVVQRLKHYKSQQSEQRLKAGNLWENRDLVFPDLRGGYFNPRYLEKTFALVIQEAGLPRMRFHDLRHSAATLLLSMGVEMKVIQEILGHSHFSLTADLYSHVLLSMQENAMDKWDKQLGL